jgi:preprotein translocase subunit SecY
MHEGQRRIPVQYAKRVRGNRQYGGQTSHIPLKVNMAGMIPLIFAQSIIVFPGTLASYGCPEVTAPADASILKQVACFTYQTFSPQYGKGTLVYSVALFVLVFFFTYFYTKVIFEQQNIPTRCKRTAALFWGFDRAKTPKTYSRSNCQSIDPDGGVVPRLGSYFALFDASDYGCANRSWRYGVVDCGWCSGRHLAAARGANGHA